MRIIRKRAFARAGLIGNPTDGYGGKTISFTFEQFSAQVVLYQWDRLEIVWSQEDLSRFDSLDELVQDVRLNGYYGGVRLIKATIKRFAEFCEAQGLPLDGPNFSVRYQSDIPRGVGLSGSSAIVVATLKCLMEYFDVRLPREVVATLARNVELEELGIACGYQDRVVQVYDGLVSMDFGEEAMHQQMGLSCGRYEQLDSGMLPPLYIAYDLDTSAPSSTVHGPLSVRVQEDARLRDTMREIAALAPLAKAAILKRDTAELHRLVDRNFDYRASLYAISDKHRAMVDAARKVGASAKFAGSGGAIVGVYDGPEMFQHLKTTLESAENHCRVIRPKVTRPADV